MRNFQRKISLHIPVILAMLPFLASIQSAGADPLKKQQTPRFWQRDARANFENQGRNHCAPTSIAGGLIYLAKARGFSDLVDETDHDGQIALITELAKDMDTDPKIGTNPDKILTGLLRYAKKRGYSFERLELASWRGVSAANKKYKIGAKPKLAWMTAAAKDPDVIEIFNFGWYKEEQDGSYSRHSGHWVSVVGAGPGALRFDLHNPILKPERQKSGSQITLKPVDKDFAMAQENADDFPLSGYYQASGAGLPFNPKSISAAVLDGVIIFKLKKN